MFHVQSCRWHGIAEKHVGAIHDEILSFVSACLCHITSDKRVRFELDEITGSRLRESKNNAKKELDRLRQDERQQPITYNHYYTDNIQNARQEVMRKMIRKAMDQSKEQDWNGKLHVSNNTVDAGKLLASLQKHVIVNMEGQACAEALAGLEAYYKVSDPPICSGYATDQPRSL